MADGTMKTKDKINWVSENRKKRENMKRKSLLELLSKYDPLLQNHLQEIQKAQLEGKKVTSYQFKRSVADCTRASGSVKSEPEVLGLIPAAVSPEWTSSLQSSRQKPVACAYMAAP